MTKFLPGQARIDSFGNGGFRFGGMSHKGSLLILPSGMRAWDRSDIASAVPDDLAELVPEKSSIDFLVVGTGLQHVRPASLVAFLRAEDINAEFMATAPAINVYNVVLAEGRRVAAALIAI